MPKPFDVEYASWDKGRSSWRNYGQRWDEEEKHALVRYADRRYSLRRICEFMGRPPEGVISKLRELHKIEAVGPNMYQWAENETDRREWLINRPRQAGKSTMFSMLYGASETTASNIRGKTFDSYIMDDVDVHASIYDAIRYSMTLSNLQQLPKETIMNQTTHPNIETKTFINGADANSMSDAQIFSKIATLEAEHNRLDGIQNKPKKLVAAMAAIKEDIAKLVAYVDGR